MQGVIDRDDLGSWMDGAPADPDHVKGSTWGLPAEGPGAVAGIGRRFASYAIDWLACLVASLLVTDHSPRLVWPLYAGTTIVLLSLFGATLGQFVLGLRTIPVARRWPMPVRAVVRIGLLLLLIPTLVWNRDGQPVQDVAAGTAVIRV